MNENAGSIRWSLFVSGVWFLTILLMKTLSLILNFCEENDNNRLSPKS